MNGYAFFGVLPQLKKFLDYFNLPHLDTINKDGFNHCSGTMFIVSNKITKFFKNYDRIELFNMFNLGFPKDKGCLLEHGFEVFLGYYFEHLQLKTLRLFSPELLQWANQPVF